MDILSVASLLFGFVSLVATAVVAIYVGKHRGIDQVEDRTDGEIKKLVDAQAARLLLLEQANRDQAAEIATLKTQVAGLKAELDVERRISLRFRTDTTADGR